MVTVAKNKEVKSLPVGLTKRKVEKLQSRGHSEVYPGSRSSFRMWPHLDEPVSPAKPQDDWNQCGDDSVYLSWAGRLLIAYPGLSLMQRRLCVWNKCQRTGVQRTPERQRAPPLSLKDASSSTILHLRCHLPKEKRTEPYKKKPIDSRQTASIFTHGDSFELGESVFSFLNASVLLMFSTLLGEGRVVLQRERHDYWNEGNSFQTFCTSKLQRAKLGPDKEDQDKEAFLDSVLANRFVLPWPYWDRESQDSSKNTS